MAHEEKHFTGSQVVRDIVIGMSDGLTVPFALAAGLTGAVSSNGIVITAGVAEIIAGSIAMGLGGYLAGKTDYDHYFSEQKRELYEVEALPEVEKGEIREILAEYGLSRETQDRVVDELAADKHKWVGFMMKFELGLEEPKMNQARNSAITIALSYVTGGFIPLLSYFFTSTPVRGLYYSMAVTIMALLVFGWFKGRITGQNPYGGALKTALIGAIAAGAAFLLARQFS